MCECNALFTRNNKKKIAATEKKENNVRWGSVWKMTMTATTRS